MVLTEKATEAAKNPWGQWAAVILALTGIGAQYFEVQQTKVDLVTEQQVSSEKRLAANTVNGNVDEKLAENLADTQEKLIAVWKHCEEATTKSRAHAIKQDAAIERQQRLIRRVAFGMDDVRFTVQLLHPNRRNAAFNREESFTEAVEDGAETLEKLEDTPAPMPPPALKKGGLTLKRIVVDDLRKMRQTLKQAELPKPPTPPGE